MSPVLVLGNRVMLLVDRATGRLGVGLLLVGAVGCSSTTKGGDEGCTPRGVEACLCPDGSASVSECQADQTFGPCQCGAGGAGGDLATGGQAPAGGTGGNGGLSQGNAGMAGRAVTGGAAPGGANAGGGTTAGAFSGGAGGAGGVGMGGVTGGADTGGAPIGGADPGGAAPGGANTGGASTGGTSTGGMAPTGGASTGGASTGGAPTGGAPTGGVPVGGSSGAGGAADLLDGCVLLLHMEEAEWNGTMAEVVDASGFDNHGTANGSATTTPSGRFGRGGAFDGSGWVEVPDHPSLDATTAITVSAWVYTTRIEASYWPGYVTKRRGYADQTAFSMHQGEEGYATIDVGDEASRFLATRVMALSTWMHVAFAYDASWPESERVRLYLDGSLDRVASEPETTLPNSSAPITIGNLNGGGSVFTGQIDEVAMWNRALTAAEVARVAAGELAP